MYPGQYPQPNPRKTVAEFPMISGYSAARFYAPILATTVDPPSTLQGVTATLFNTLNTTVKLSFVPLDASTTPVLAGSGSRCDLYDEGGSSLGNYFYLSGGGEARVAFRSAKPYLEVFADGGGPTCVRVQLESLIQWDVLGFSRLDAKYPASLYQPKWSDAPWPS